MLHRSPGLLPVQCVKGQSSKTDSWWHFSGSANRVDLECPGAAFHIVLSALSIMAQEGGHSQKDEPSRRSLTSMKPGQEGERQKAAFSIGPRASLCTTQVMAGPTSLTCHTSEASKEGPDYGVSVAPAGC